MEGREWYEVVGKEVRIRNERWKEGNDTNSYYGWGKISENWTWWGELIWYEFTQKLKLWDRGRGENDVMWGTWPSAQNLLMAVVMEVLTKMSEEDCVAKEENLSLRQVQKSENDW
jgi:hypothetical protein